LVEPFGTTGSKVTVNGLTQNCNGTASVFYSFDGGTTWGTASSKTFTTTGTISVCVRVTCTVCGLTCTRTCCKNLQLNPPCNIPAAATLTVAVNAATGVATLTASTLSPAAAGYDWDFNGDGTVDQTTTSNVATGVYAVGTHRPCVTIRRSAGCSKRICRSFVRENLCNVTAAFSARHCSTTPTTVLFTATVANATGVSWNFGDGNSSAVNNPTHTYAVEGTYTVCLTAYSSPTCSVSVCYTVVVRSKNCLGPIAPLMGMVENGAFEDEAQSAEMYPADGPSDPAADRPTALADADGQTALLTFVAEKAEAVDISIAEFGGATVQRLSRSARVGLNALALPIGQLPPGVYAVHLNSGGTAHSVLLVVPHR
jgi:PKD repeat protein